MKVYFLSFLIAITGFACQTSTSNTFMKEEAESDSVTLERQLAPIPYGNNPDAGAYVEVEGVKLYYEVYGEGEPLLMLHGGVYGYIDEFTPFIPKLAETHQVICMATRGHGKSEIGEVPFTFEQRAMDAHAVLQHLSIEKALVLGFSDGAYSALKLAALYPDVVSRVIAMGVGDRPKGSQEPTVYSEEGLRASSGGFFEGRLALMPEPERWGESLQFLNHLYNEDSLSEETLANITCPVLLMNGEKDQYADIDAFIQAYRYIPNAYLSIIPQCDHVIFYCNFNAVWESMVWFL